MKNIASVKQSEIEEKWYLVDARGQRIGRLASIVAELLQGKNNPLVRSYHIPMVKVVVINATKLDFTEKRGITKFYKSYSGFPGGLRFINLKDLSKEIPERPIENAIKGMLPRTKRGDEMMANLKIYSTETHPHVAQNPEVVDIKSIKL